MQFFYFLFKHWFNLHKISKQKQNVCSKPMCNLLSSRECVFKEWQKGIDGTQSQSISSQLKPLCEAKDMGQHLQGSPYTLYTRFQAHVWPFSATTSDWTSSISVSRDLFVCMMACYTPKANKRTSDTSKMSIMHCSRQWEMFAVFHPHTWKGN